MQLNKEERERGGVWDVDTHTVSGINAYKAGYIDKDLETIVGVQTDEPFKRAVMPFGGIRMVETSCKAYVMNLMKKSKKYLQNTEKHIIKVYLMLIQLK